MTDIDVIIVGAGPAGLSCAMTLGRCNRKVVIFDTGDPRNKSARAMHGFLSRDGENPLVFLQKAKLELKKYGITLVNHKVTKAERLEQGFRVTTSVGEVFYSKKMLLATGLADELPPIKGIEKYYGRSVFHCPYCDGWEMRGQPWVVYAKRKVAAIEICLRFRTWTSDITLLGKGLGLTKSDKEYLALYDIKITMEAVSALEGKNGYLKHVAFENGTRIPASVLFFSTGHRQQSDLAQQLGCSCDSKGVIKCNRYQQTNIDGLYVAGDMARDMQFVIIAAAEGAKAGVTLNSVLDKEARIPQPGLYLPVLRQTRAGM